MKKKTFYALSSTILFLLFGVLFSSPTIAFADSNVCASGWGTSADNGTWVYGGLDSNGNPFYTKLGVIPGGLYNNQNAFPTKLWALNVLNEHVAGEDYYGNLTTGTPVVTPDMVTDWTQGNGDLPIGTITAGSCSTPTPPPAPVLLPFTFPSQNYDYASSTCTEVATTTPHSYYCTATSTANGVPYGDWLFLQALILFCVAFIPIGTLFSLFSKR